MRKKADDKAGQRDGIIAGGPECRSQNSRAVESHRGSLRWNWRKVSLVGHWPLPVCVLASSSVRFWVNEFNACFSWAIKAWVARKCLLVSWGGLGNIAALRHGAWALGRWGAGGRALHLQLEGCSFPLAARERNKPVLPGTSCRGRCTAQGCTGAGGAGQSERRRGPRRPAGEPRGARASPGSSRGGSGSPAPASGGPGSSAVSLQPLSGWPFLPPAARSSGRSLAEATGATQASRLVLRAPRPPAGLSGSHTEGPRASRELPRDVRPEPVRPRGRVTGGRPRGSPAGMSSPGGCISPKEGDLKSPQI